MKKRLISLLAILIPVLAYAQESALIDTIVPVDENGLIIYTEVFEMEGSADELYDRAEAWVKDYFPNPVNVLGKRNKEEGYITGNIRIRIYEVDRKGQKSNQAGIIHFDFKMEFKDGRYRLTMEDFTLQSTSDYPLERWIDPDGPYFKEKQLEFLRQVNEQVEEMIDALEEAMEPVKKKNDDW